MPFRSNTEAEIEKKVCAYAKTQGWHCEKLQFLSRIGAPDRIFFKAGSVRMIEFKSSDGQLRSSQKLCIRILRKFGVSIDVVDSIVDGKNVVWGWVI